MLQQSFKLLFKFPFWIQSVQQLFKNEKLFSFWKATVHFISIKKTISSKSPVPVYITFIFFLSSHLLRFFLSLPSLFLSSLCALSSLWVFCWSMKRAWVCRLKTWWLMVWWLIWWLGLADLSLGLPISFFSLPAWW